MTYVVVVEVAVNVELVESDGALEGVDKGALGDLGVGPNCHGHVRTPLLGEAVRRRQDQGELLRDQYTRFHRNKHCPSYQSQEPLIRGCASQHVSTGGN